MPLDTRARIALARIALAQHQKGVVEADTTMQSARKEGNGEQSAYTSTAQVSK